MGDRIELIAAVGIALCGALAVGGMVVLTAMGRSPPAELSGAAGACLGYLAGVLVRRRNGAGPQ